MTRPTPEEVAKAISGWSYEPHDGSATQAAWGRYLLQAERVLSLFSEGRGEQDRLTEDEARERLRALIGASSVLAWATANGLTGQQVDSFLRGDRPLEPKLATAMGLRRVCVYEPMEATHV